jgi:hypothetical protein
LGVINEMAGPAVTIILKTSLTDEQRSTIWERIRELTNDIEGEDFWINGRPFVLWFGEEIEGIFSEIDYENVLGWIPKDAIGLAAMCNDEEGHIELAKLALEFALKYDGLINFDGVLNEASKEISGKLWEVPYETGSEERCISHVGDTEFLKSWINHEKFRMIK